MKGVIEFLRNYMPKSQLAYLVEMTSGEEGYHFRELLEDTRKRIEATPPLYANEELGTKALARLHYFGSSTDIWISELNKEESVAFGYTCLNGDYENAELGYVSIPEIITCDGYIELDLYWCDKTLEEVMERQ